MRNKVEKIEENPDFREFLNREVDHTVAHATIEELAEFAFGSIDEAVKAFEEHNRIDVA